MKKALTILLFATLALSPVSFVLAANLYVPFTSQAPEGDWSQPWFDACEEASLVMVAAYYSGINLTTEVAKEKILQLFDYKNETFGESLDENSDKLLTLIDNYYSWSAVKVFYPTVNQIKSELDAGRPVIAPVAGFELGNPHFRGAVPYHVIVLKGYDDATGEFIANDPGTQYGADFRYLYETIINANHDFVARDVESMKNGPKAMIFTDAKVALLADGSLVKAYNDSKIYLISNNTKRHIVSPEIFLGNGWSWSQVRTVSADSLAQYSPGEPVNSIINAVYKPTAFERGLKSGTLIKSKNSVKVYLLENGQKRYIVNPQVFVNHRWSWSAVKVVSQAFVDYLSSGENIIR
jgi:hypothetical protein